MSSTVKGNNIIIIERKDLGGVMSKDCKDTLILYSLQQIDIWSTIGSVIIIIFIRAGFNWWEAWGPDYLGGSGRLQQLYD